MHFTAFHILDQNKRNGFLDRYNLCSKFPIVARISLFYCPTVILAFFAQRSDLFNEWLHMRPGSLLPILALIDLTLVIYFNTLLTSLRPAPTLGMGAIGLAHFSGTFLMALLLVVLLPKVMYGMSRGRKMSKTWCIVRLACVLVLCIVVRVTGLNGWLTSNMVQLASSIGMGMLFAITLYVFFCYGLKRRGLAFGGATGIGLAVWKVVHSSFNAGGYLSASTDEMAVLYAVVFIALIALIVMLVIELAGRWETPPEFIIPRYDARQGTRRKNILKLFMAGIFFYLMNGFLDGKLFLTYPGQSGRFYDQVPSLVIIACPLVGLWLDHDRAGAFKKVMTFCAVSFVLSPSLLALGDSPIIFSIIYGAAVVGQISLFVTAMVVTMDLARGGPLLFLTLCAFHFFRGIAVLGMFLFKINIPLSGGVTIILATLSAIFFYLLVNGIDLSILTPPASEPEEKGADPAEDTSIATEIAAQSPTLPGENDGKVIEALYAIKQLSPRECQIADMLVKGSSTREIAEHFYISEHTVKTHIKRILTKFGVPNRRAFLAVVISGTTDTNDAIALAATPLGTGDNDLP